MRAFEAHSQKLTGNMVFEAHSQKRSGLGNVITRSWILCLTNLCIMQNMSHFQNKAIDNTSDSRIKINKFLTSIRLIG